MNSLWQKSLGHAALVVAYVSILVLGVANLEDKFTEETVLLPIMMLLLFVLSATIVGSLVLARPILMYLNGHKVEAMKFLGYTIGWLVVMVVILLFINLSI
jgi:hypothetical protein